MQPPAVQHGRELVQAGLRGIEELLDPQEVFLQGMGREGGENSVGAGWGRALGARDDPHTHLTPYLSRGEEGQSELDQSLGLDLHGGERALEDGESLRGGSRGIIRAHRLPGPHPEGLCAPHTCWKGLLRLCSQYR